MRNYDLTPLWRSFDAGSYPPCDIERTGEDDYRISLAVAGFTPEDITITARQNMLMVKGRKVDKGERQYVYQGISARPFRHVFNLADYVQVKGATFESGLLKIDLVREVPEAMKPRKIPIGAPGNDNQQIERKTAA